MLDELSDPNYYAPRIKMDAAPEDKYGLNVREVRKVFPPKRHGQRAVEAVRGCTFGVRTGEVFGLLSVWKSKSYVAFGSSPLDGASTAASSPRNDLVKNCRAHPTHCLISTQVIRCERRGQDDDHVGRHARRRADVR